jgi:hypothetical protein
VGGNRDYQLLKSNRTLLLLSSSTTHSNNSTLDTTSIYTLIMRLPNLVAGVFGAFATAAPIEEAKTAVVDLTQVPDAFAGTAWFSGGGSTYMSVVSCVRVPKIIQSFAVLKGSACYIYQ